MLCDAKGRFLFEVRPDLFPHGRLTQAETELWGMYFEDRNERAKLEKASG